MMKINLQAVHTRLGQSFETVIDRWAVWLVAAVFGGACSALAHALFRTISPSYPDFVVGYLTLIGTGKAGDYAMLFGFMLGSTALFTALAVMFRKLFELSSAATVEHVYRRFIVAVVPVIIWFATFLIPRAPRIDLFWISALLIITATLGLWLVLTKSKVWLGENEERPLAVFDAITLFPAGAIFTVVAVGVIGSRVGIFYGPSWFQIPQSMHWGLLGTGLIAVMTVTALVLSMKSRHLAVKQIRNLLIAVQVLLPGLFLTMLPSPVGPVDGLYSYASPIRPEIWIFLAFLTLMTWADLVRLWRQGVRDGSDPAKAVSIFSLIAILVCCRVPILGPIGTPFDDYHSGEDFIPFWSWLQHGMIPLWDFTPPRGLINYEMGLLASIFTEHTASGMIATKPYLFVVLVLLVFPAVALAIGKWRAFVILSLAALDERLGAIDALMAACLCLLVYAWVKFSHVTWLVIWLVVGTTAVLIAPGQGGLLVVATMPGGLWRLYRAFQDDRARLLRVSGIIVVIAVVLAIISPLDQMIAGAVRYGVGQSAVNGIANGIPWRYGTASYTHPWFFEIVRFSWIGVGAIAIIMTVWAWAGPRHQNYTQALFIGTAIAILCLFFIVRSAVRIDSDGFVGRPGFTSIWAMAFLMPLLVTTLMRGTRQLSAFILAMAAAAPLTSEFGLLGIETALQRPFIFQAPATVVTGVNGADIGMPNLGVVKMEPGDIKRLVSVKQQLDRLLAPEETFIDMTNHGAQYYYFDRPPPSDVSAFYNMITHDQQRRAVAGIVRNQVPVALSGAENLLYDGLSANLRANLVYRYLVLNFVPVTLDGQHYMIRPDRLERIGMKPLNPDEPDEAALQILDRDFPLSNLDRLPASFGKSAGTLEDRMRDVVILDPSRISTLKDAERIEDGSYRATGAIPSVTFDLSRDKIRGRDAGLLRFDFQCLNRRAKPAITIRWAAPGADNAALTSLSFFGKAGTLIVPLDAAPRWLLSSAVGSVRFELTNPDSCTNFTLTNIALAQRTHVDDMDKDLRADTLR